MKGNWGPGRGGYLGLSGCEEDMAVTPSTLAQMSDDDLNTLHGAVADCLITLKQQSEAFGGKARILIVALATQLDEKKILDYLLGLAILADHQAKKPSRHKLNLQIQSFINKKAGRSLDKLEHQKALIAHTVQTMRAFLFNIRMIRCPHLEAEEFRRGV